MAKKVLKTETIKSVSDDNDLLSGDIFEAVNKKFKDVPNSLGYLSNSNLVDDFVSTGSKLLDLAISNRVNGGMKFSSFMEIYGGSASGKSLMAAHLLAETQKLGGMAALFDTENAVGMLDFYKSIGLNTDKLFYTDKIRALEDIFETIELIIEKSYQRDKNKPITIVIDSIMGATTHAEQSGDYDKEGWATAKAIILSKAMRKLTSLIAGRKILIVFINQVRANLGVTFGSNETTSGGKAVGFHSSVRLKTKSIGKIIADVNGVDVEIGSKVQVHVVKNRYGPPGRSVVFNVMYDSGIDDAGSWLEMLKTYKLVTLNGSWYTYVYIDGETGEEITKKFLSRDFKKFVKETEGMEEHILNQIADCFIMKYKINEDFGIDDLKIESNESESEE